MCFYDENAQKVNFFSNCIYIFPQIGDIIQGTLLTFLPKKVIFSSKCACISSTILTILPNNPVCFYTKNSPKVHFPSNCAYNRGQFLSFLSSIIQCFDPRYKFCDFFIERYTVIVDITFRIVPRVIGTIWFKNTFLIFQLSKTHYNRGRKNLKGVCFIGAIWWKKSFFLTLGGGFLPQSGGGGIFDTFSFLYTYLISGG